MDTEKIDELMKERLYTHKSEVSDESWAKLEFILDSKEEGKTKGVVVYWRTIAAAVVLLVMLSWLGKESFYYWQGRQHWKTNVSLLNLTKFDHKNLRLSGVVAPVNGGIELSIQRISTMKKNIGNKMKSSSSFGSEELSIHQQELVVDTMSPNDQILKLEIKDENKQNEPVRIVYKRSSDEVKEGKQDSLKTNRIIELLNTTKSFQPGELLADVRSAKDKVLQKPFGISRQRQKFK